MGKFTKTFFYKYAILFKIVGSVYIYIYIYFKEFNTFIRQVTVIKSDSKYFHIVTKNYSLLIKESRKKKYHGFHKNIKQHNWFH